MNASGVQTNEFKRLSDARGGDFPGLGNPTLFVVFTADSFT